MNTLVIVLIAAVLLTVAYAFYGRWLSKKWGIDPKAETPAHKFEDGQDYVPTDGWTVFSHQFSSIAGAGPVTGAIQAAVFGWLPVLLWVLIGGIFFGAVTDFGALYASVKNDGKSMGLLIEKYIGKLGRKLFLIFCWLFTLIVIAAFADLVAGTFNAYTVDANGVIALSDAAKTNGAAGTISLLFIAFAMIFGLLHKHLHLTGWKETVVGLICTVAALAIGMTMPITLGKDGWTYITFVYIFFAAVLPMWLLKQPRDAMTTYMFIGMIAGAVVGLLVAHPTMIRLNDYNALREILDDKDNLEKIFKRPIYGLAYPNGSYDNRIVDIAKSVGIKYARVTNDKYAATKAAEAYAANADGPMLIGDENGFSMPEDYMCWVPTCHHNHNLIDFGKKFMALTKKQYLYMT